MRVLHEGKEYKLKIVHDKELDTFTATLVEPDDDKFYGIGISESGAVVDLLDKI